MSRFNDIKNVYKELFNNSGIAMYCEVMIDEWKNIMDINLWGVMYGTQVSYQIMKVQGFGHIINTSSAAGLGPSPISTACSTTKHVVVGLTISLHYEAEEFGIKVSTLCLAIVDTPIFDKSAMSKQLKR